MTPSADALARIEERINNIGTQYRESPVILGLMRNYLGEIGEAYDAIQAIPDAFDLDTSVGDQLTIIGKWLGFPRRHCVCTEAPVFGFSCGELRGPNSPRITGFCEDGEWQGCGGTTTGEIFLQDDEIYRRFLKVRRYQYLALYDLGSLQQAAREMWGAQAVAIEQKAGEVVLAPFRPLTEREEELVPIVFRVMPIAPGVKGMIHRGYRPVFGFGTGWTGFCEAEPEVDCNFLSFDKDNPVGFCEGETLWNDADTWDDSAFWRNETNSQDCDWDFGFCGDQPGFCSPGPPSISDWFCPEDPRPYTCNT